MGGVSDKINLIFTTEIKLFLQDKEVKRIYQSLYDVLVWCLTVELMG